MDYIFCPIVDANAQIQMYLFHYVMCCGELGSWYVKPPRYE